MGVLWYVGADGSIQDKYWYEGGNWGGFPLATGASLGASVGAVTRRSDALEVFYEGLLGSIEHATYTELALDVRPEDLSTRAGSLRGY